MSRPVQIVVTLVLFTAIMVGLNAALRPAVGSVDDWLVSHIGSGWTWALLILLFVPAGLWGYWDSYRAGKAARTRSD